MLLVNPEKPSLELEWKLPTTNHVNPDNVAKGAVGKALVAVEIVILVVMTGAAAALSIKPSTSVTNTSTSSSSKVASSSTTTSKSLSESSSASTGAALTSMSLITSYPTGTVITETSLPYTLMPVGKYNLSGGIVVYFYLNNPASLTGCFTASVPINYLLQQSIPDPGTLILAQGSSETQHCFNNASSSGFFYSIVVSENATAYLTVTRAVRIG